MLNPGSKMLTGCGLNYKTFVQISFLIFQFDHFGRWVPKKYFTLICYDSRNTNLQPLVIYISWFLQRKSQAYSLTTVCDKSCHTFSTYMPRCNIWLNNNRNKPAYTSLSLQVFSNVFLLFALQFL